MRPLEDRFWEKVEKAEGCWLWTGGQSSAGYGKIGLGRRADGSVHAHRVAWELAYGDVPDGLVVHHECRNRLCVNPEHLRVVTPNEHPLLDETIAAGNAARSQCPQGHEYDYIDSRGARCCLTCRRDARRRWRAAKRTQQLSLEAV